MSDDLLERARFVVQLFRECDAIQLPHGPTEQVLTGMIDRIEELEAKLKTSEEIGLAFEEDAGQLRAKLATCEKYRDAYAECDRIGTQAVRDLEAKLAKVTAAYRIEVMQRGPWTSHEHFDRHIREITGGKDD